MPKSNSKTHATDPQVDAYFNDLKTWRDELLELRSIVLDSPLVEVYKWRSACYAYDGKNVAILGAFKDYCSLSFFKGALLSDPKRLLDKPGENTQSGRLIRFTSVKEITAQEPVLKNYLAEAIENEKAGRKVEFSESKKLTIPDALQQKFDDDATFEQAFLDLTPGRQRAYIMFIDAAKQAKTKVARIEKYEPRIRDGKGMNDCVCGLSKRMPGCDGSHNLKK